MVAILYDRLRNVERMRDRFNQRMNEFQSSLAEFDDLPGFPRASIDPGEVDIAEMQRTAMQEYEQNPVLGDAILEKQSVTKTVEELISSRGSIWLPRRKDKIHNERLSQLSELVHTPRYLRTRGILAPDNALAIGVVMAGVFSGFTYSLISFTPGYEQGIDPEKIQQFKLASSSFAGLLGAPTALLANLFETVSIDLDLTHLRKGAQYIDERVQEFYS